MSRGVAPHPCSPIIDVAEPTLVFPIPGPATGCIPSAKHHLLCYGLKTDCQQGPPLYFVALLVLLCFVSNVNNTLILFVQNSSPNGAKGWRRVGFVVGFL